MVLLSAGLTTATEVEPVMPKTVKTIAASTGLSRQLGRCCSVHFQNWLHALGCGGFGVALQRRRSGVMGGAASRRAQGSGLASRLRVEARRVDRRDRFICTRRLGLAHAFLHASLVYDGVFLMLVGHT